MSIDEQPSPASEERLVERFRSSGDNRYFEALYRATRSKVISVCLRLLRHADLAEDAAHDTFLRAYERFPTLEGNHFSAWVCRIATNLCLNRIRDEKNRVRILESAPAPPEETANETTEDRAVRAQESAVAIDIVQSLSREQKRVLLLRYVDGCSYREIEDVTGYNGPQVRSYLQNARRNFQLKWNGKFSVRESREDGTR